MEYCSSNPLVLLDTTERNDPWRIALKMYKGGGTVKVGPLERLAPESVQPEGTNVTSRAATNAASGSARTER